MRILGIDPALHTTGYGLIDFEGAKLKLIEAGFIKTNPKTSLDQRLKKIFLGLEKLLKEHKPEAIVIEKIYAHFNHPATAFILGHARGVVCLAASLSKVPIIELAATKVKKSITGAGHASKLQVKRVIQYLLNLKTDDWPEDVSDALALAITYANIKKHGIIFQK